VPRARGVAAHPTVLEAEEVEPLACFPQAPPTRGDLSREAIRLELALAELMPDEAEVRGLLALMLLNDSRSAPACAMASWSCSPSRTNRCGTTRRSRGAGGSSTERWPCMATAAT